MNPPFESRRRKVVVVDPERPDATVIQKAAEVIRTGGLVCFPTTGLYGLGADAMNEAAVAQVYALKKRPTGKPLLMLISDVGQLQRYVTSIPAAAERIISTLWPGGVTIVFQAADRLPAMLTAGTGKIGIRLVGHPVARQLIESAGRPITGTSANVSGREGGSVVSEIEERIIDGVDMVLDAGRLAGGAGSTVIDVTTQPPVVIRQGAVSEKRLAAIL